MDPASSVQRYDRVAIADWQVRCAAGADAAGAQACLAGRRAVAEESDGRWRGRLPGMGNGAQREAIPLCLRALCRGLGAITSSRPVHLAVSTSKGQTPAWLAAADPTTLTAAAATWPGSIGSLVARELGLGWFRESGPVAACSTGLYALLDGADAVQRGLADVAVCGAIDRSLQPLLEAGFAQLGVLSRGCPSAFTAAADGFVPGEGGAVFSLCRRGTDDPSGWRLTAGIRLGDAGHETRCIDPRVLQACLAGLWAVAPHPEAIITHGTGTRAGDAYEGAGLAAGPWRSATRVAWKPLIGHCLGASGAVELGLALHGPWRRIWKLSLGFGGHIAAVACERG